MAILINEARPELYNAHLLDYSTGSVGPNVSYFSSDVSMFFVKYTTKAALRTITAEFEFVGENEFEAVRSQSDFTAMLMNTADLKFPDGFCYHCMLTKVGTPSRITDNIYTVSYTFIGYRHLPEKKLYVSKSMDVMISGNYEASCILDFKISNTGAAITISNDSFSNSFIMSGSANTVYSVDGLNKKILDSYGANAFSKCDLTDFPRLAAGINHIAINGITDFTISYLPIYV